MAQRGRKPKPAAQRRREGNPGHRPIREGFSAGGEPVKPDDLSPAAEALWDEVVPALVQTSVVGRIDGPVLELMCQSWGILVGLRETLKVEGLVERGSTGQLVEHPLLASYNREKQTFLRFAEQFGLTSSARMRVAALPIGADAPVDPFTQLSTPPRLRAVGGKKT